DAKRRRITKTIELDDNARPTGLALSPTNRTLYVATGRGGRLVAIDRRSLKIKWSVPVGDRAWGVALTPNGKYAYTANGPSDDVTVVDAVSGAVVKKIHVPGAPWAVAIASASALGEAMKGKSFEPRVRPKPRLPVTRASTARRL